MRRFLTVLAALLFPVVILLTTVTPVSATTTVPQTIIASQCRTFRSHSGTKEVRACVSVEVSSTDRATVRTRAWIGKISGGGTIKEGCVNHIKLFVGTLTARESNFVCKPPSGTRVTIYTAWWTHKYVRVRGGVYHLCLYYTGGDYACTAASSWFYSGWYRTL
jgi:hypothetical protein